MKFLQKLREVGEKIKLRWEIQSYWQMAVIFIVFSITGSSAVKLAAPVLETVGINDDMSAWLYWPLRIIIIFPVYQLLLIFFGWLFGQFDFFWKIEKKMIARFAFKRKNG
jgi:manganese efflux pump family protein